jgi:ABC-type cobalamin/Fe3+-siderophores transport system ATPase subunit
MTVRRGGVILIVGPDGAGKSSLADALEAGPLAGRVVLRVHQRARLLPRHTHC